MGLTDEQLKFANHPNDAFVQACPGAGKTRTVVARLAQVARSLPPRKGVAMLSFTNTAVDEFAARCQQDGLDRLTAFPSFVGTFDAFVRHFLVLPSGIEGVAVRPTIVDSWEAMGVEIRLAAPNSYRGGGVLSLDRFDPSTNTINPIAIARADLRQHVQANQDQYQQVASYRRRRLRGAGFLSAADTRVEALQRLRSAAWSEALSHALAARFHELIVDEAQDCNPLDLQILAWLRGSGVPVSIVCDVDQAIYGFREGDPARLTAFAGNYRPDDRLPMTGNFRSSEAICKLAATLRSNRTADRAVGDEAANPHPINILEYPGSNVPSTIGIGFLELLNGIGCAATDGIILAHRRNTASRACGDSSGASDEGGSNVATIAWAVGQFASPSSSGRERDRVLRTVERMLLELMGKIDDSEPPARAVERHGIDARWLRRTALSLITSLPKICPDTSDGAAQWLASLHNAVDNLSLTHIEGRSTRQYFKKLKKRVWVNCLTSESPPLLRYATVHEAKGRQYDAVCVVIPPDRGQETRTAELISSWESQANFEPKRVIYVGVTRAKKLVALAVPATQSARVRALLTQACVPFQHHLLS